MLIQHFRATWCMSGEGLASVEKRRLTTACMLVDCSVRVCMSGTHCAARSGYVAIDRSAWQPSLVCTLFIANKHSAPRADHEAHRAAQNAFVQNLGPL